MSRTFKGAGLRKLKIKGEILHWLLYYDQKTYDRHNFQSDIDGWSDADCVGLSSKIDVTLIFFTNVMSFQNNNLPVCS